MSLFDSFGSAFGNFLSDQGQRLTNVWNTEKAVVGNIVNTLSLGSIGSQEHISSTLNNPFGNVLATAANNPLTTAALIAIPSSSVARTGIGSAIAGTSTTTKAIAIAASPIVIGLAASNPVATVNNVIAAPSNAAGFGKDIGLAVQTPNWTSISKIVQEHPILSTAAAAVGITAIGGGVATAVNALNTSAVRSNTKATIDSMSPSPAKAEPATIVQAAAQPTPAPMAVSSVKSPPATITSTPKKSPARKKRKKKKPAPKKRKKKKVIKHKKKKR